MRYKITGVICFMWDIGSSASDINRQTSLEPLVFQIVPDWGVCQTVSEWLWLSVQTFSWEKVYICRTILLCHLFQVLRPFLLRRLKVDVEKQMPQKFEHVVMCHLSKRQRYLYDDFMSQAKYVFLFKYGSLCERTMRKDSVDRSHDLVYMVLRGLIYEVLGAVYKVASFG